MNILYALPLFLNVWQDETLSMVFWIWFEAAVIMDWLLPQRPRLHARGEALEMLILVLRRLRIIQSCRRMCHRVCYGILR